MRILVAHSFYRVPGGEDRYVTQQVGLLQRDHEVELFGPDNRELASMGRAAVRMTMSPRFQKRFEDVVDRFRPDVIHLHNAYPSLGPSVHLTARRRRIPLVMTVHNLRLRCPNGLMFTEGSICSRCEGGMYAHAVLHDCFPHRAQAVGYAGALFVHRFLFRLEKVVSLFICPSDFMKERLRGWGIKRDRLRTIRNFTEMPGTTTPSNRGMGLYVGRLSTEKGVSTLLDALHHAGDPPFRIVGDGPQDGELRSEAQRLSLKNTEFLGRVDRRLLDHLYRESGFLVMPSLCEENAPLAVLEAMASGRPVLVADRGGLSELVVEGGGLVCDPTDTVDMATKIRSLVDDDELRAAEGKKARAFVGSHCSAERHRADLLDAYLSVTRT
jgi:glycosyltransferase involved in cell wall biosynthesis